MQIFATANDDSEVRRQSSSGGAFSVLAEAVIARGGFVYGAAFDQDWNIIHVRVDNADDLARLRGSKYAYSNAAPAIADALTQLAAGREVLFCGTPCQTAAMRKRAGDNPHLLCVEIVCHGAPEQSYWQRYLAERCASNGHKISDIAAINFRDKRTGWKYYSFTISFSDGTDYTRPHGDEPYMRAFLNDLTLRPVCFRCPFKRNASCADITLGDLWGISQLAPAIDDDRGTTLVIARTPAGISAAASLPLQAELSLRSVLPYNGALVNCAKKPRLYGDFRKTVESGLFLESLSRYTHMVENPGNLERWRIRLMKKWNKIKLRYFITYGC